ncbi:MAG: PhoU domain-containing protein, partial [Dehalococcoidales bacterium]
MNLWRGEPLMKRAISRFADMLSGDEFLFTEAWEVLKGQRVIEEMKQDFYGKDKAINEYEHEIRRILLEHLTLRPISDVPGSLAMMSLVKDAERIGDYAKNIFEVGVMMEGRGKDMKYMKRLSSIQAKIAENFPTLKSAFLTSDEPAAKKILQAYAPIKADLNKLLQDLFNEQLSTREAVATALLSRYLKR